VTLPRAARWMYDGQRLAYFRRPRQQHADFIAIAAIPFAELLEEVWRGFSAR